jgi:F-type H+-transporting ATPase subunit e
MAVELGAPVRVSPLIKAGRWTALIAGIYWGTKRYNANKATEDEIRAYNAKMQPVWDAEKAAAAAKANREQMIYLAQATGTPIPEDF